MMKTISSKLQRLHPYFTEGAKIISWFFLLAVVGVFTLHSAISVLYFYPLDYGEAPLIDQAIRLSAGENIYRADLSTPPYTIANYPPLYIISLLPSLGWFDSPFHMGRVISVVATVFSALFIGFTISALRKAQLTQPTSLDAEATWFQRMAYFLSENYAPLVAALFFLASPYVVQWSGRARIDSLALAFATAALFVLARWPRARWAWLIGGILLLAAIYTRQSYLLAAPLAAFVWLWVHNKRQALALAFFVGGAGLALFFVLNLLTDGGFYYNIVTANVNEFGWERLEDNLRRLWEDTHFILLLSVLFLLLGWRTSKDWQGKKSWPLLAPFFVGAFLSGLTIGKIGSNINYFLELAAALALIAGILILWSRAHPWRHAAVILLISIQFGILMASSMRNNVDGILTPRQLDFAHLQFLEQEVIKMDDPVLADEYMGMLTINDRALYLQPFEVSQMANAEMWDQQPLLNEIAAQNFDGILIHHFSSWPVHKERWTPEMLAAIEDFYRPVKTLAGTVIYLPQGPLKVSGVPAPTQNASFSGSAIGAEEPILVGSPSFVGEPSIAIHPNNPLQLAAIATRASKQDCELPNCKVELVLFTSVDGGQTWQESAPFGSLHQVMYQGLVEFDASGVLYILGIRNSTIVLKKTGLDQPNLATSADFEEITSAQVQARPWLRIRPQTGELFLSIDAQEGDRFFITPSLLRSPDGFAWTRTARADQRVSVQDIFSGRANGLSDIQVLLGEGRDVSLVWVWDTEPGSWPRTVWMSNSSDGGITFTNPAPILQTWGPINTAASGGRFAIVYRVGDEANQQLAVAVTEDNGQTWDSAIASGDLPLYFEADKGPGLSMAPNGTIDLVFYAHANPAEGCVLTVENWQLTQPYGRIDPCEYNVFYTYSKDSGMSFAEPIQLNTQPIRGEDFARFNGASQVGSHLDVISGDDFAYPIWIGTPSEGKTQIYTAKIER